MRTDEPTGIEKKLDTEFVDCPKCAAPMLIATIEINRVIERVTYRCEPCGQETVREEKFGVIRL